MFFKALYCWAFPYSLSRILAQTSRQSIQHLLLGQPYNVRISGTEIEELHRIVHKEYLQRKKAEISLCYFSKDEYAVKEFLKST
jgi:hypothetical protein